MPMRASALMNVMIAAARKAGRSLARDFGEVEQLQVSVKGPANFVSAADHRAEEIVFRELSKARPGYGFLMEEAGVIEGADKTHRWIVDPLDGTTNFLHGIPLFSISIGLEREGQLVAGLIYNPVSDELFTAEKGRGAFVNDRRLRVAARQTLADAVVATGSAHRGRSGYPEQAKAITREVAVPAGLFVLQSRPETVWSRRERPPVAAPRARAFDHVITALGSPGTTESAGGGAS